MNNRKETLLTLHKELSTRVDKINKDLHNRKTSPKFSDQATDRQNDDVLLNLKDEAQEELLLVKNALLKLERGIYGTCEKCHEAIREERLNAVPFAAHCSDCAA